MGVSGQTVCPGYFMARQKALVFIDLEAGWALELVWIFGKRGSGLARSKIFKPIFSRVCPSHYTEYAAPY